MVENGKHLKTPSDNTIIWRYMDFPKLLSIFTQRALWFSRMDKLTDEHEGTLPTENLIKLKASLMEIEGMRSQEALLMAMNEEERVRQFKEWTLVNSWSINDTESFALWKIYLGNSPYGIAIRTNVGRLKACFENIDDKINLVKVNYIGYFDPLAVLNQETVSASKMNFYSYENELRAVIKNQFDVKVNAQGESKRAPRYAEGKNVPVNPRTLIERIYTSPMAPLWFTELVERTISELVEPGEQESIKVEKSWIKDKI